MAFEGTIKLLEGATSAVNGKSYYILNTNPRTFQVILTGGGAITATVLIQGSLDPHSDAWVTLETFNLSGTDLVTDGNVSIAPWAAHRAVVSTITGTDASVDFLMTI